MFDFVRRHTRVLQFVMMLLIFPAFIGVGVFQTYSSFRDRSNEVAVVAGQGITLTEWENAQRMQADGARARNPNLDPALFESPQFKRQILDALIRDRVFDVASQNLHLQVSDNRLKRLFANDPQMQSLRNPDGTLNKDILANTGLSPAAFTERLRAEYATRQVTDGVERTVLAPKTVAQQSLEAVLQRREVQVARFDAKDFLAQAQPTAADLQSFYADPVHAEQFMVSESADIDYVVLDLDSIKAAMTVSDADVRKFYDDAIKTGRFSVPEERRASHILINADKADKAENRQAARAKAVALLAQLRKTPSSFADVARKNSQDTISAANGGDLGFFGRDAMVKPFEDAAFALKSGQISDVVESDFGYHIIMVTGVRGGERKPFDTVRQEIANEIKAERAKRQYAELAQRFTDLVYEQPDSLKPVADALKLPIQTASGVTRKGAPALVGLASPKFLDALFDEKVRKLQRNTEAMEAGPNRLIAARVRQYFAQHKRPFAEVETQIRTQWTRQKAAQLAKAAADARLAAWTAQPESAQLNAPLLVSRNKPQDLSPPILQAVMQAKFDKLPAWTLADLGGDGWAVIRINRSIPPELSDEERAAAASQYAQMWSAAEVQSYYQALHKRFKAQVTEAASAAMTGKLAETDSQP